MAKDGVSMSRYYQDAVELARMITAWSKDIYTRNQCTGRRFIVCSGGGPGIMEAANRGASEAGGYSIGLNISLPFEQEPNPYISRELRFEFHYFFVRKFWLAYLAKALIIFPGGFGTLDEMMEILTLVQTGKITKSMPIILFGSSFWKEIINFQALVDWGMIKPEDLDLFTFCDTPQEAFDCLKNRLEPLSDAKRSMKPDRSAQRDATIALKPFEPWAAQAGFSCSVRLRQKGRMLLLCYSVHGPLEQLLLPVAADCTGFKPELWRTTCMECFLRPQSGSAYVEWNFSPAGNWWVCAFDSYRVPALQQPDDVLPVRIRTHQTTGRLDLQTAIPLLNNDTHRIEPAVILEHADGQRSHWATAHPDEKPDFHRPLTVGAGIVLD